MSQITDKRKIISCGKRKGKKKKNVGMIHMSSSAVVNEQCQLIDLNINASILQRIPASCSHIVKKSRVLTGLRKEIECNNNHSG